MLGRLQEAILLIDKPMIREWVEDLVLVKTFTGLCFQEALIARVAEMKGTSYRLADAEEESQGIDGYIGDTPVSVKPSTYTTKDMLPETIDAQMIVYEKKKDGISFRSISEGLQRQLSLEFSGTEGEPLHFFRCPLLYELRLRLLVVLSDDRTIVVRN